MGPFSWKGKVRRRGGEERSGKRRKEKRWGQRRESPEKRQEEYKKRVEKRGQCPCCGRPQPPQACWGPGGSPSWSPAPQPRLSPGQGWLHNGGGRCPAGCHVGYGVWGGGCSPAWLGLNSSPEARAFPDALAAVKGAGSCQQQGSGRGPPAAGRPDGCNMRPGDRTGCTGVSLRPLLDTVQDPPSPVLPSLYPARLCIRLGGSAAPQILLHTWR